MGKRARWLAEISLVTSKIIGRRYENYPYEHASPVAEMNYIMISGHFSKRDFQVCFEYS